MPAATQRQRRLQVPGKYPRLGAPSPSAGALMLLLLVLVLYYTRRDPRLQPPGPDRSQMGEMAVAALAATATEGSRCGPSAMARGPHQRVAAFSFYGAVDAKRGYFKGIERNAAAIGRLYPGWTMRLYHDVPPGGGSAASSELDRLSREFPHLDLCYVGDVPGYGDLRGRQQNAWRFLAMADPLVDVFISRDLDALPLEREVQAVSEWLESNATFHVMRDHPWHNAKIMAGMWGARPHLKRENLRALAEVVCAQPKGKKGEDQSLLARFVWPAVKGDVWQHDAYHCKRYRSHGHMQAFPTRRNEAAPYNFVGNRVWVDTLPMLAECPKECRPTQHQDWLYC